MITTRSNFDLSAVTTFAIPARCDLWVEYDSQADIPGVLSMAAREGKPFLHIGEGSNMLFTRDFPGIVAHSRVKGIEVLSDCPEHMTVRVGAGVSMDDFVQWACNQELWGIENLSGIPGEAGASAVQNVGAYGTEAADTLVAVHAYDRNMDEFVTIPAEECCFGYRDSLFKHPEVRGRYVIHHVDYRLSHEPRPNVNYPAFKGVFASEPETPRQVRDAVLKIRDSKLPAPARVPSAGSFFKNPVVTSGQLAHVIAVEGNEYFPHYPAADSMWKIPAAWLIDRCGWKGQRRGNAAVWHLQPLVITNPDRLATGDEIVALENEIRQSVVERYGIELTPEVEHI